MGDLKMKSLSAKEANDVAFSVFTKITERDVRRVIRHINRRIRWNAKSGEFKHTCYAPITNDSAVKRVEDYFKNLGYSVIAIKTTTYDIGECTKFTVYWN